MGEDLDDQAFYQIIMPGIADGNGISHLVTRLVMETDIKEHSRAITGNTQYWSPSSLWMGPLPAGGHTLRVQYRTPGGGTNTPGVDWQNRVLHVLVLGS